MVLRDLQLPQLCSLITSRRQWPFASRARLSSSMYLYCSGYMYSYGKYTDSPSRVNFMAQTADDSHHLPQLQATSDTECCHLRPPNFGYMLLVVSAG